MQGSWHNHSVISAIINPCQSKDWQMKKTAIAHERNAKNDENSPSLVFFHRKLPKTAFRLQATSEKRGKQSVARGFSSKIAKNSISLASDERKTMKTVRRSCFFHRKLPKTAFRL